MRLRKRAVLLVLVTMLVAGVCGVAYDGPAYPGPRAEHRDRSASAPRTAGTADGAPARQVATEPPRPHGPPGTADAPDSASGPCASDMRAQHQDLRARLEVPASPQAALAYLALGRVTGHTPTASVRDRGYLREALERWPTDLDLAWLNASECRPEDGCDRLEAVDNLVRLEPGNAATWMQRMALAAEDGDTAGFADALRAAGDAGYYDSRPGSVYLALRPLLAPPPPSCLREDGMADLQRTLGREATAADLIDLQALGMEIAAWTPAYGSLARCGSGTRVAGSMRGDCIRLVRRLAAASTLVEQRIGVALLLQLVPDEENRGLREHYRRLEWLTVEGSRPPLPPDFVRRRFSDGEVDTIRHHLASQQRWPPPAGWLPDTVHARALVETGKPPSTGPRSN